MGFYLRKSISVGPLRFNLSGSGVGVSAGVRGLRFGAGPRGNYVHMGRGGLYYRATVPSGGGARNVTPTAPPSLSPSAPDPTIPPGTHDPLVEMDSTSAAQIVDSSSAELLRELNEKRRRLRRWPFVLVATGIACAASFALSLPWWSAATLASLGGLGVVLAYQHDVLAKTVVLFYGLEPDMEKAYGMLHASATQLAACARAWHIEAQGRVQDRKYHAGASSLVRRQPTFIRKAAPPYVKTNLETVAVGVGRQVLHFFPDRILVYDANGVGAVPYSRLRIAVGQTRFIEDGPVPPDAKVVDQTWKYVNKKGGPDRRFKDNRQMPICLYDEISLQSDSGLNELIQVSRCEVAGGFAQSIQVLAGSLPAERPSPAV